MPKILFTVRCDEQAPTLENIQKTFSLLEEEVDAAFGVVEIDPEEHLYAILVEADAVSKISPEHDWKPQGPFSNPRIAPFGPPDPPPDSF